MILFTKRLDFLDLKKAIDDTFCGMIAVAREKVK